jgi:hypothetical protein
MAASWRFSCLLLSILACRPAFVYMHELTRADTGTRMSVFTLDGNPRFRTLLPQAITPANVTQTVAVVVLDMSRPWQLMRSLETWLGLLSEFLATLGSSELEENKTKRACPSVYIRACVCVWKSCLDCKACPCW